MTNSDYFRGLRSVGIVLAVCGAATTLAGCEALDDKPSHSAGWTLLDPTQRHPIMVQQQPHTMSLKVPRGQHELAPSQRAQLYSFLDKYRASDSGNSKLVISVPAGSANEVASMRAIADIRPLLTDRGFPESAVSIEPYSAEGDSQPPIRVSYMRFHAEGPECGRWPDNLAESRRNTNYHNFACAQQRNLAAQIANPADLLGPRTMTSSDASRRAVVHEKYTKGEVTGATRSTDERASKQTQF
jgi:pilus assembly protein CpaD